MRSFFFLLYIMSNIKKKVEKIRKSDSICDTTIFNNEFTKIYRSKNPVTYLYRSGNTEIFFPNVVTKVSKFIEAKTEVRYYKKAGKNVVEFLGPGVGEIMVNEIINKLFFDGITPHFAVMLGYSVCNRQIHINMENLEYGKKKYTSFDKIDEYLYSKGQTLTRPMVDSFIISILHSCFVLEHNFSGIHMDLEYRNVFIKEFDDKNPYFRSVNMRDVKYFEYNLPSGKSLYVRNYGFILKIGDFDGSVISYKNSIIVNNHSTEGEIGKMLWSVHPKYPKISTKENTYVPGYHLFFRLLIDDIGYNYTSLTKEIDSIIPKFFKPYDKDIDLASIQKRDFKDIKPLYELLSSKIFEKYHIRPKGSDEKNTMKIAFQ